MKKPTLKFLGNFAISDPVKVPLHDATVNVGCEASNGDPDPLLTASIVDLSGNKVRDLKERVSQGNVKRKIFALNMTEEDVGKFVECNASQGIGEDVTIRKTLAIYCDCSEVGSQNKVCNPENGQCPCKQDYTGRTCHEFKGQFKPQCNDKNYHNDGNEYEHGKEVNIPCNDETIEIQNCKWTKVNGGPSCSAETGEDIWKNVYKKFSKEGCSLNFETLELGHGGTYECELTPSKTGGRSPAGKMIKFKTNLIQLQVSI